jgi:predicted nuclease of predicted toxin-antitoxin system
MLVADESVDFRIGEKLRSSGIDVYAITEQSPSIVDEDVLNIALQLNAPLLTEDKDFGELVFRLGLPHKGILLLRVSSMPSIQKVAVVTRIILEHIELLYGAFSVFDGHNLRIRRSS